MLLHLIEFIKYQYQLITDQPTWLGITYAVILLLPVLICLGKDHSSILSAGNRSTNTIHTLFWLCMMLILPFFGSLLYLAGSLVPHIIWSRKHPAASSFPYQKPLRGWQFQALLLSVGAGFLIGRLADALHANINIPDTVPAFIFDNDFIFEISFLCWLVLILRERSQTLRNKELYFRIPDLNHETRSYRPMFGADYNCGNGILETSLSSRKEERIVARAFANEIYNSYADVNSLCNTTQEFSYGEKSYPITVLGTTAQWLRSQPDVIDSRYIGHGISRLCIAKWDTQEGSNRATELVVYKAVPRYTAWLWRAAVLLFIQLTLCSGWAVTVNLAAVQLVEKILSNFK